MNRSVFAAALAGVLGGATVTWGLTSFSVSAQSTPVFRPDNVTLARGAPNVDGGYSWNVQVCGPTFASADASVALPVPVCTSLQNVNQDSSGLYACLVGCFGLTPAFVAQGSDSGVVPCANPDGGCL